MLMYLYLHVDVCRCIWPDDRDSYLDVFVHNLYLHVDVVVCGCIWPYNRDEGPTPQTTPSRVPFLRSCFYCI